MPVRIEPFAGRPLFPDCETCPHGGEVALTAVMWGVPDAVRADGLGVSVGTPLDDEEGFFRDLAPKLNAPGPCCLTLALRVRYDPTLTVRETAEQVASFLSGLAFALAQPPWVARVRFHLIGFSAGGQVAINAASLLPAGVRRAVDAAAVQDRLWCGKLLGEEAGLVVPTETDVVTVATPLGSSGGLVTLLSWAGSFFAGVGRRFVSLVAPTNTFRVSVGEDDYGGPPPDRLCRFVAFVTSGDYDKSFGADEDPCDDPARLGGWQAQVVRLDQQNDRPASHTASPGEALARHPSVFAPGCACVEAPPSAQPCRP